MTDDRDKKQAGNDAPKERWWKLGRRSRRPAARSISEDAWTWLGDDATAIEPNQRRYRRSLKIAGILACCVVAGVTAFVAINPGNSGDAQVSALASPPLRESATVEATVEPPATAEPTPVRRTPAPTPQPPFTLSVWDATQAEWQTGDLTFQSTGSSRGDAIPYLVRINDVTIGNAYAVNIRYDCDAGPGGGFAFLTDYNRNLATNPALAAGGPMSAKFDAAVPILDDASTTADEEQGVRRIAIWGAAFEEGPSGPEPTTGCDGTKLVGVRLLARSETAYLMWAGQTLSLSPTGRFGMEVTIDGLPGTARLDVVPAQ